MQDRIIELEAEIESLKGRSISLTAAAVFVADINRYKAAAEAKDRQIEELQSRLNEIETVDEEEIILNVDNEFYEVNMMESDQYRVAHSVHEATTWRQRLALRLAEADFGPKCCTISLYIIIIMIMIIAYGSLYIIRLSQG
jgi:hypothetical protein